MAARKARGPQKAGSRMTKHLSIKQNERYTCVQAVLKLKWNIDGSNDMGCVKTHVYGLFNALFAMSPLSLTKFAPEDAKGI